MWSNLGQTRINFEAGQTQMIRMTRPGYNAVSYVSVDDVIAIVTKLGKGAALAKLDIKQTYRHVPVSPLDRQYLGMQRGGNVYIDTVLLLAYGLLPCCSQHLQMQYSGQPSSRELSMYSTILMTS